MGASHVRFRRKQPIEFCAPSFAYDPLLEQLDNSPNLHLVPQDIPIALSSGFNTGVVSLDQSVIHPPSQEDTALLTELGRKIQELGPLPLLSNICGLTDQNVLEQKSGLAFQISMGKQDYFSFSSTLELDHTDIESRTYLNGEQSRNSLNWSNNLRYYLRRNLIANIGVMLERNNRLETVYLSSRASVNYIFLTSHILRLTTSYSERSPDIYELDRDWNYQLVYQNNQRDHNGNAQARLFRNATSPDRLDPEIIRTIELAYHYGGQDYRFDMKYFRETLDDLISGQFLYLDFDLSNNGSLELQGYEASYQQELRSIPGFKLGLAYTYLDNKTPVPFEATLHSNHFGNLWMIYPIMGNTFLGLSAIHYDDLAISDYTRFDLTLSHLTQIYNADVDIRLNYRRYPESIGSFTEISSEIPIQTRYDTRDRFVFSLSVEF